MALPVRRGRDRDGEIARFSPLDELDRLQREISRTLETWRHLPGLLGDGFIPPADVEETDDAYVVEVELPGVKKDDIDIEVAGRRIAVRGERKERERVGILRHRDRVVGRFSYEVTLPGEVDEDAVEASLDEGVLTVRAAKPERDRPRRVPVR